MKRLTGTLRRRSTRMKEGLRVSVVEDPSIPVSQPEAPQTMPEKSELDRMYKQLLEDLAIPEAKRQSMIETEADDRKWKLLQHHSTMIRLTQTESTKETQQPKYWVAIIQGRNFRNEPTMTISQASELQAVIRTSHKQFLSEFIELEGVLTLIDLTRYYTSREPRSDEEREILPQIMTCFKALMNNQLGMESVLQIEDSITAIAMAMDLNDVQDIRTTQEVVMLLAVTCFYSSHGRNLVVKAMDDIRIRYREAARFESLVNLFEECNDNEFRAAVIMFITTIVNSAALVDSRIRVRNDFLALDIMRVFEHAVAEASDEDQASTVIATQFQVFEDMMVADHSEVIHSMFTSQKDDVSSVSSIETDDQALDLSDQLHVFDVVRENALRSGCPELLLEMTQALLLVPSERTLAVPVWTAITKFVREATSFDNSQRSARSTKLNYSILRDLLDKRLELDRNFSQLTSSDDIIEKQRARIKELERIIEKGGGSARGEGVEEVQILKAEIDDKNKEIEFLKKSVAEAQKGGGGSGTGNGAGTGSEDNDPKAVLNNLFAKRLPGGPPGPKSAPAPEIPKNLVVDSTGLAPAGPAPGKNGGPPPPVPLPGMPGSLDDAPVKLTPALMEKLKKIEKEHKKNGKKKTKAKGGEKKDMFADVMKLIGSKAESAKKEMKGTAKLTAKKQKPVAKKYPDKKPIYPNVKMRSIFWTKIQNDQLDGTIWPTLNDSKIKIEAKQLEAQFGKDMITKSHAKQSTLERKAKQEVHLCDSKRQQNIGIALSRFRVSDEEIRNSILDMDPTLLTLERSRALMLLAPTPEEIELVNNFEQDGGKLKKLCREDRFLREMTFVPRMKQRMECIIGRHTLEPDMIIIKEKLKVIREANAEVENSKELKKLLEIVLAIGNYTNGGTPRGQAYGFKLDALSKLETVKANGGKHTLMHFLVQLLELHYPKLLNFRLTKSEAASEYSLSDLQQEINQISKVLGTIKQELEEEHPDKKDKFVKMMSGFEVRASKRLQELRAEFDKLRQDFQRIALWFAEKGAKVEPVTLFTRFVRFQQSMINCKRQIEQQRLRAERQKKMEEEKKRRATLRKMREMQEQGGGVFEQFAKANAGNASDIVENFLQRYRKNSYATLRDEQTKGSKKKQAAPEDQGSETELMAILARRKQKDKSKRKKKKKKGKKNNADFAIA